MCSFRSNILGIAVKISVQCLVLGHLTLVREQEMLDIMVDGIRGGRVGCIDERIQKW